MKESRCICKKGHSPYWPPDHVYSGDKIIGDANQFCIVFLHIMPCWELDIKEDICLYDMKCSHSNVTIFAHVEKKEENDETWKRLQLVRYTNCYMWNRPPKHAEEFMIKDSSILIPNSRITIYTQLQPCHHSGGKDGTYDSRSCTELVLKWYREELVPRNIELRIKCANIYKAAWTESPRKFVKNAKDVYSSSVKNSLEGLRMILREGIAMDMILDSDWDLILSEVSFDPEIIPPDYWKIKEAANLKFQNFIEEQKLHISINLQY